MRAILNVVFNFVFYGIIYYVVWRNFPEFFDTLVSWASGIYDLLVDLGQWLVDKINALSSGASNG